MALTVSGVEFSSCSIASAVELCGAAGAGTSGVAAGAADGAGAGVVASGVAAVGTVGMLASAGAPPRNAEGASVGGVFCNAGSEDGFEEAGASERDALSVR